MTILIRPATRADVQGIVAIYNQAVRETTASYDYEPVTLAARLNWFDEHERDDLPVFVAEDAGEVVGWSALNRYHTKIGYQFTVENSIYVALDHCGQGIGKLLMPPLIDGARKRHKRVILAGIDADNEASLRLHCAFGFEAAAHFKQVGWKFGRWLDVIYLQLLLNDDV
ncbi:MAG: L-amino acid N-acyltransferase [Abditibacteriota bacterium]|jgi:L-amino acid N-acyltransferase YncA|nr:L-amino acid N-acyltransferase [Abditibacteriota bacterium]